MHKSDVWPTVTPQAVALFEAKVDRSAGQGGCHGFTAAVDRDGYGLFQFAGAQRKAHRFAWFLSTGVAVPFDMTIDHLCKNRSCVNPAHLDLVRAGQNTRRGNAPTMLGARRALCANGHEFDSTRSGGRYRKCRTCQRDHQAAYRARLAARA